MARTTTTTKMMSPSAEQLEALRSEAAAAGDSKQVAICERAIAGSRSALRECARVLRDSAAQR